MLAWRQVVALGRWKIGKILPIFTGTMPVPSSALCEPIPWHCNALIILPGTFIGDPLPFNPGPAATGANPQEGGTSHSAPGKETSSLKWLEAAHRDTVRLCLRKLCSHLPFLRRHKKPSGIPLLINPVPKIPTWKHMRLKAKRRRCE